MTSAPIRTAALDDLDTIKQIAVAAEMFSVEEVEFFDEMFGGWLDGSLEGHRWLVAEADDGGVVGAANYAPEPFADRMWNLYFIAVEPSRQGGGIGRALMAQVEAELVAMGDDEARVLIVETSSTDQYALTRESTQRSATTKKPASGSSTARATTRSSSGSPSSTSGLASTA